MHFLYSPKKGVFHNTPARAHALGRLRCKITSPSAEKVVFDPLGVNCHYVTFYLSLAAVSPRTHFLSQSTLNYPGPKTAILLKNYQVIYLCIYARLCQNPQSYSRQLKAGNHSAVGKQFCHASGVPCDRASANSCPEHRTTHGRWGARGSLLCRNDIEQIKPGETLLNKSNIIYA